MSYKLERMQKNFDKWNSEKKVVDAKVVNTNLFFYAREIWQFITKTATEISIAVFGCYIPFYELLPNITHEFGTGEALFGKSKFRRRDCRTKYHNVRNLPALHTVQLPVRACTKNT